MQRVVSLATLLVTLIAATTPALARDVYLNGVKLDPNVIIKSQTFPDCSVVFDEHGDVRITAKGFKVDVKPTAPAGTAPAPAAPAALTRRYWLVSKQPHKGQAQYDVEVYLNGKLVKKVRSQDDPVILEVTRSVRPGANAVKLVATKVMGDKRLSASPTDTLEVMIGEGDVAGGTVSITKPVVTYVRTAQETQGFADDARFEGR